MATVWHLLDVTAMSVRVQPQLKTETENDQEGAKLKNMHTGSVQNPQHMTILKRFMWSLHLQEVAAICSLLLMAAGHAATKFLIHVW